VTFLIVLAVAMVLAAIPVWPYSRYWGYVPSGGLGLLALIITALLLAARS
jgi:Protein of unknown function (DUF3309)